MDSKQPQFRKSFAEAVQQQQHHKNPQPTNLTNPLIETNEMEDESENNKCKRSISTEKNSKSDNKKCLAEAVCVHPDTGKLFTAPVEFYNPTDSKLSEIDITSENNPTVRKQAQNIYDQY